MAVFRVERTQNYTVMSNYHLRDRRLSLKAKGLLSLMLSLPEDWDYTLLRPGPHQPGGEGCHSGRRGGAGAGRICPAPPDHGQSGQVQQQRVYHPGVAQPREAAAEGAVCG